MTEIIKTTEFEAYGVKILKSSDARVRIIKQKSDEPALHGQKIWGSSLLLMDYFQAHDVINEGTKVLEAGCGWGLTGVYAAQKGAQVTAVDADRSVFPYLNLHGAVNDVEIHTLQRRFERLTLKELQGHELLFGGDVCFWDELVDVWFKLIGRAFRAGFNRVVLADPGRTSFHELAERCLDKWGSDSQAWRIINPRRVNGYILDIKRP